MKRQILIIAIILFFGQGFAQQKRTSRAEYILQFSEWAVKEMKQTGIPASITLAQGCLESDDGNSILAREGNNHFGIKCHSDWTGEKMYKDDDQKGECFRKYPNAKESFKDHSEFLAKARRYAALFQLDPYDYKAWARGLKDAGYATNPKYPEYLIKIIEDNKLYEYDKGIKVHHIVSDTSGIRKPREKRNRQSLSDPDNFNISLGGYEVKTNNRVKYIIIKSVITPDELARSLDLFAWEILRYNDLTKDSTLHDKQLVYIQPKRNKAEFGKNTHTVKEGETLYSISQFYAVKMKKLLLKNNIKPGDSIKPGDVLYLRNRKPIN